MRIILTVIFLAFVLTRPLEAGQLELTGCMCNGAISPCETCSPDLPPPNFEAPLVLTSITPEMFSPDFWINRLPNPDALLKTPEELRQMNEDAHREISDLIDVFKMDLSRPGGPIRDQIELEYSAVRGRILFDIHSRTIPKSIFDNEIKPLIQTDQVSSRIQVKWGAATTATSVRALPSDVKMLEEIGDIEFDQLQFTLIKLWTPVGILHESSDGRWLYIQAPYTRGWVKARDIAIFPSRDELKRYVKPKDFLVATGESISIFTDSTLQRIAQRASMGTILPPAGQTENAHTVWLPTRGAGGKVVFQKGYVDFKSDFTIGSLPYTQRNIIRQAFKLLGARYGWGGEYQGRDCSGFTQDVFLSMGVDMPRNSKEQAFIGTQIDHFKPMREEARKVAAIRSGTPGVTLMRMPLHQMLYLGEINGQFYAIHSTWAERISKDSDQKVRINQVVVSDLTLNGKSYLGSLFDRIISVSEIN